MRLYVEILDDQVMFDLDDFVALSAMDETERVRTKEKYHSRLTLRGIAGDLFLVTPYEELRDQLMQAARAAAEMEVDA